MLLDKNIFTMKTGIRVLEHEKLSFVQFFKWSDHINWSSTRLCILHYIAWKALWKRNCRPWICSMTLHDMKGLHAPGKRWIVCGTLSGRCILSSEHEQPAALEYCMRTCFLTVPTSS